MCIYGRLAVAPERGAPYNARRFELSLTAIFAAGNLVEWMVSELPRTSIPRPPVHRITIVQLAVLTPVVVFLWMAWPVVAKAMLAGAVIEILARAYFNFYAFRFIGAQHTRQIMRSFRQGELGKFMLVAVLFGGLFAADKSLHPLVVFVGYFAAWLLGTFLSMRLLR